jgi:Poly(ADP-ribose) polymerase and DNA-Ligase Zn-finger region
MKRTNRTSQRLSDTAKLRSTITPSPKSQNSDDEGDNENSKNICVDEPIVSVKHRETERLDTRKHDRTESKNDPIVISNNDPSVENVTPKRVSKRTKTNEPDRTGSQNIITILKNDAKAFQVEAAAIAKQNKQNKVSQTINDDDIKEVEEMICVPCATSKASVVDSADSNSIEDEVVAGDSNNGRADHNDDRQDNDDEEDRPFTVEYATSSRATCRRCDAVIGKGDIRISHVPLFRGKPGYRVYRHLQCAIFSEDVVKIEDVGGWRKLDPADLEQLRQRIQESMLEIERENEDLDPDELVQKGFQGEIRKTPAGFVGTQLPFQIEGQSWMYHQEVHVPEIRGGILADEMGMVSFLML